MSDLLNNGGVVFQMKLGRSCPKMSWERYDGNKYQNCVALPVY